ncbi:MAG TPA: hypothetical protein V6D28_17185 [Leptolyngbyaceae cyanobacterium]
MSVNLFNANLYRSLYPDLARAGLTSDEQLRQHFLTNGINEGRRFSSYIDLNYYTLSHPDLRQAGLTTNRQLFDHLENFGASEGRRVGIGFNPNYYKAVYKDLAAAGFNNEQLYQHYEQYGIKEGRIGSEFFDPVYYLNSYSDLKAAFGNNYESALNHFLNSGIREGRIGAPPISPATDPGNTTDTSYSIGVLLTRPTYNEFLNTGDQQDMYSFILDKPSYVFITLNATLDTLSTVKLYADSNGNQKIDPGEQVLSANTVSFKPGSGNIAFIQSDLAQGSYYVDIVTGSPTKSISYSMTLGATAIPTNTPSDPGNTAAQALDVGNLSGSSRDYQDLVGTSDRNDFYRFVITDTRSFNLFLSNISNYGINNFVSANIYFDVNNDGVLTSNEYITGTVASATSNGSISRILEAGTYYVDISPSTPDPTINSTYTLAMSA